MSEPLPVAADANFARMDPAADDYAFSYEARLHETFPALHDAQGAWLAAIESMPSPDRKTAALIRMVCLVLAGSDDGVARHARLAAEVGATWDEILGAVMLTTPSFGLARALAGIESARRGFDDAATTDDDPDGED